MGERPNIYEMYIQNNCRYGFYVKRDSWKPGRFAMVIQIEFVQDGKMIKGEPPYFGGFINPEGHPRAGKKMGPRLVTLKADWFDDGGIMITDCGGNFCWARVDTNKL